ncbi:PREDICTED: dentin sialophosphoprotein [Dufourea novaeangliae]|uniref:dentin sialophosphoprotein n=1 Tax=Dufourea novaeangliae TaxID=178035 RepID=UPI000766E2B1|nr:PREDICTED: dentin sialophosphoprotein [Dufourea novaeangliae]
MDIPPTQVYEADDFTPTQKLSQSMPHKVREKELQIGILTVGCNVYPIKEGINKIGRHPECNIILNDQTVSKNHAEIEANSDETSAWICDLHSSNKTKLNNSIMRPGRCYELKDGSVIQFGMVCAVYKVNCSMDESLILETPASCRLKKQQMVIPGTPDSSMNNSSTMENISIIPGTQADNGDSVFRRPSLSNRRSTSNRKSFIQDFSIDDSMNDSRNVSVQGKEHVDERRVSIHDMETLKSSESQDETNVDIHDVETQKISLSSFRAGNVTNIHDVETQHEEDKEIEGNVTNIHDVETQHDIDIHDMKTPKTIGVHNVLAKDGRESIEDVEKRKIEGQNKYCTDENVGTKKMLATKAKDFAHAEQAEIVQPNSQEYFQLSLTTNFDGECSELDRSRNLLGSQNLLENFIGDDNPENESRSKSSTPVKSPTLNNNETTNRSSDDENIFDAVTQVKVTEENISKTVTQQVNAFEASSMDDDSDETDQEGVFQTYSRIASQDSSQNRNHSQSKSDSDSSDTDEEGRFTEMALKEKRTASLSFETRQNESKLTKNDTGSSRDSDDMFNTLTQQVNVKKEGSSKIQSEISKCDVDFDTPTQVIEVNKPENNIRLEEDTKKKDIDYLAATQVLPSSETSITVAKHKTPYSEEKNDNEIEYNTPTQIITENVLISNNPSLSNSDQLNPNVVEECSIEDIDYEMAPTQLLRDCEEKISVSIPGSNKISKKSNKVNLNDTLEKNLNKMFDSVNDEDMEDQPQISTQVLTSILQASQSDDKPTSFKESQESSKTDKSVTGEKGEEPVAESVSPSLSTTKLRDSKLPNRTTQDSQNYFSNLVSKRKRNIIVDSPNRVTLGEDTSDNKKGIAGKSVDDSITNEKDNTSDTLLSSTPKSLLTPRSSKRNKTKKSNESKIDLGRTSISNSNENVSEVSNKDDQVSVTTVDTGQPRKAFMILESDEDFLAGLPEVQISGTLSNPPSPTSSTSTEFRLNTTGMKSKQSSKKAEPKKRVAPKKSTRRSLTRKNTEENKSRSIDKSNYKTDLDIFRNVDVDRVLITVHESDDDRENEIKSVRTSSRKFKKSESLQQKSSPSVASQKQVTRSISIQNNARTRASSKENVDRLSIFQVDKEVPSSNKATESEKKTTLDTSRSRKRLLNTADRTESNNAKKRKEDDNGKRSLASRGKVHNTRRIVVNRKNSANILDYVTERSSPVDVKTSDSSQQSVGSSQDSSASKQLVVKIIRLSSSTPTETLSPSTPTELMQDRRMSVNHPSVMNNSPRTENNKTAENRETKRNKNRKAINKRQLKAEDMSSQVGEESQEVEMIMNSSLKEQCGSLNVERKEDSAKSTSTRTRSTRARRNTNVHTNLDATDGTSFSSDIYESDNARFEVPMPKAKRTKISKKTTNIDDTDERNTPTIREMRNSRRPPSRSTSNHQYPITDSSTEGATEANDNEISVNNTVSKKSNPKKKERKPKTRKLGTGKKNTGNVIDEETTSSEMNSSIDNVLLPSTPFRTRRSMSIPFSTSSPYKEKHKILFTGISKDYSKLLAKLGASQVEDPTKCSVLVTDKVRRTVKFLCALAQSVPIVAVNWLVDSEKSGHFLELDNYILKDPVTETKFGFILRESLHKAKKQKLLDGYTIVLTPNVAPPPLPELKSIISSCGGKALVRPPSSWPQKAVIVSRKEDLANAKKFLAKAPKTVTVQSTELILTGILRQELDFVKYNLM